MDRALLAQPDLPGGERAASGADIGRREAKIAALRRFWSQPDVRVAVEANIAAGDEPRDWRPPLEGYERDALLAEGMAITGEVSSARVA